MVVVVAAPREAPLDLAARPPRRRLLPPLPPVLLQGLPLLVLLLLPVLLFKAGAAPLEKGPALRAEKGPIRLDTQAMPEHFIIIPGWFGGALAAPEAHSFATYEMPPCMRL